MKTKKTLTQKKSKLGGLAALVATASLLLLPLTAAAHRVGIPITTLEWHGPGEVWHVVHQLSVHDFSPLVDGLDDGRISEPDVQAAFGRYVIEHFSISGQTETIEMSYLGAEEDADSFFVYFILSTPDQSIRIDNKLAFAGDADERRHALVNIEAGEDISTLIFTAKGDVKTVTLNRPAD